MPSSKKKVNTEGKFQVLVKDRDMAIKTDLTFDELNAALGGAAISFAGSDLIYFYLAKKDTHFGDFLNKHNANF